MSKTILEHTPVTIDSLTGNEGLIIGDPARATEDLRISTGQVGTLGNAEWSTIQELVYPYWFAGNESYTYTDGQLTGRTTNDGAGTTWTMTVTQSADGVSAMQSADGADTWDRAFTYNADGSLANDSGWIKL